MIWWLDYRYSRAFLNSENIPTVWRIFTAPLIHGGLFHIVLNMLAFIPLGQSLEASLGSVQVRDGLSVYRGSPFGILQTKDLLRSRVLKRTSLLLTVTFTWRVN